MGRNATKFVEGIINGLTPDARALIGKAPPSLAGYEAEHAEFRALFDKYRGSLLEEFEKHRPSEQIYSPLSFNFNFPHNAVKGFVASAISRGGVSPLPVNDLLTGIPRTPELEQGRKILVKELTDQARTSPDIIRGRPVPIFSYDPYRGIRKFTKAIGVIRELGTSSDFSALTRPSATLSRWGEGPFPRECPRPNGERVAEGRVRVRSGAAGVSPTS